MVIVKSVLKNNMCDFIALFLVLLLSSLFQPGNFYLRYHHFGYVLSGSGCGEIMLVCSLMLNKAFIQYFTATVVMQMMDYDFLKQE